MPNHIHDGCEMFKSRLRELIERHEDLSISEVGRRIGHKSGTNVSVMISKSKSGRDDLRMSTFLKICNVLAKAYEGRMSEREIAIYLLGFQQDNLSTRFKHNDMEPPWSRESGSGGLSRDY